MSSICACFSSVRAELGHVLVCANRERVVAGKAIGVAELLVKNGKSVGVVIGAAGLLAADSANRIAQHSNGVVVAALVFVEQGFVEENFERPGVSCFARSSAASA